MDRSSDKIKLDEQRSHNKKVVRSHGKSSKTALYSTRIKFFFNLVYLLSIV